MEAGESDSYNYCVKYGNKNGLDDNYGIFVKKLVLEIFQVFKSKKMKIKYKEGLKYV